ncbi:MAG: pyridoxal phosphate-dependent aminotransferase [Haloferacaceae archaeon]
MSDYDEPLFQQVVAYADAADRDVVGMVSGNPDWGPPPALREGLREAADAPPADLQYPPAPGLPDLRAAVAARHGVATRRVLVTAGATEALSLGIARALSRGAGEEVVVVDPTYPYYPAQIDLHGGEVVRVPAAPDGGLDPGAVRATLGPETAGVVLTDPNNPTGAVYDPGAVRAVLDGAAAHDALVVRDEVYDAYDLSGSFESALSLATDAETVVVSAASKTFAVTGLRIGWAIVPPAHVDALRRRHLLTTVAASRPAQVATLRALQETDASYGERARDRLRGRRNRFCAALDGVGADYSPPQGGFYVLADLPGVAGDLASVERLVDEAGVAGMPGAAFGSAAEGLVRFSLTTDRVDEAVERLRAYLG